MKDAQLAWEVAFTSAGLRPAEFLVFPGFRLDILGEARLPGATSTAMDTDSPRSRDGGCMCDVSLSQSVVAQASTRSPMPTTTISHRRSSGAG